MAEDITSTETETGAGVDNTSSQVAETTSQEASQGQETVQSAIDNSGNSGVSSNGTQGRPKNNGTWAAERVLEKKLAKMLDERLNPVLERFKSYENPPAPTRVENPVDDQPDYNNLSQWIQKKISEGTQRELSKFQKEKLSGLDQQVEEKLSLREARSFLLSQPEIGGDEEKMDEIKQIMKSERLDFIAEKDPVWAVKKAVSLWKKGRTNPNAPPKDTLTTVTGGAGNMGKPKSASVEELRNLQKIITSDVPESEKDKAFARIDEIGRMAV